MHYPLRLISPKFQGRHTKLLSFYQASQAYPAECQSGRQSCDVHKARGCPLWTLVLRKGLAMRMLARRKIHHGLEYGRGIELGWRALFALRLSVIGSKIFVCHPHIHIAEKMVMRSGCLRFRPCSQGNTRTTVGPVEEATSGQDSCCRLE